METQEWIGMVTGGNYLFRKKFVSITWLKQKIIHKEMNTYWKIFWFDYLWSKVERISEGKRKVRDFWLSRAKKLYKNSKTNQEKMGLNFEDVFFLNKRKKSTYKLFNSRTHCSTVIVSSLLEVLNTNWIGTCKGVHCSEILHWGGSWTRWSAWCVNVGVYVFTYLHILQMFTHICI